MRASDSFLSDRLSEARTKFVGGLSEARTKFVGGLNINSLLSDRLSEARTKFVGGLNINSGQLSYFLLEMPATTFYGPNPCT